MGCNMKPPVAKKRLTPEQRTQVLELRRTHSAAEVARQTGPGKDRADEDATDLILLNLVA